MRLGTKGIRKTVERIKRFSIPPESCGCVKYAADVARTCGSHTVPMTQERIVQSIKLLHGEDKA